MIVLRQKEFSVAGREWAGFKSGMKGAMTGAGWGAVLAPGNLIAASLGHPKTALGITAAGSLIGGGIGFKLGRDSGISEYKYKNDPAYKEKIDKESEQRYIKEIRSLQEEDETISKEFNLKDWKELSKSLGLPPEILKYIKFYESWRNNIKLWYSKALPGKDCDYWAADFKSFFPIPMPAKVVREWCKEDKGYSEIILFTANSAGDDGFVCYDLGTKLYGWDLPNDTPSLKALLKDNVNRAKEISYISKEQESLVEKFLKMI